MSGVFVSYRRVVEVEGTAGRLHDALVQKFGKDAVFMDVDSVGPGEDWVDAIDGALAACDVVLALIHPDWVQDDRLRDEESVLRSELDRALSRRVLVVPVLVNGAEPPRAGELPDTLKSFARKQAISLRHRTFWTDLGPLVDAVRNRLGTTGGLLTQLDAGALDQESVESAGRTMPSDDRMWVFLSSSLAELAEERMAVDRALESSDLPLHIWRHEEDAGATAHSHRDVWRDAVERSDFYLGILGRKLGPYTLDEFEVARAQGKQMLVFVKRLHDSERDPELRAFLERWGDPETGLAFGYFETADELAAMVTRSLTRQLLTFFRKDPGGYRIDTLEILPTLVRRSTVARLNPFKGEFYGREDVLDELVELLGEEADDEVIGLVGPEGSGKTSVLRKLTEYDLDARFPDGVGVLIADPEGLPLDVLHAVFDAFYTTDGGDHIGWSIETIRSRLPEIRALLVFEDVTAVDNLDNLVELKQAMPESAVCFTSVAETDVGWVVAIEGFEDDADVLALFEASYRAQIPEEAVEYVLATCRLVRRLPGAIKQLGRLARREVEPAPGPEPLVVWARAKADSLAEDELENETARALTAPTGGVGVDQVARAVAGLEARDEDLTDGIIESG